MFRPLRLVALLSLFPASILPAAAPDPLIGDWALVLPTGEAGWLSIRTGERGLAAELMWAVGSARPLPDFRAAGGAFSFSRSARRPMAPKSEKAITSRIEGRVVGDTLRLTAAAAGGPAVEFTGKRLPPLPARPDLSQISFGPPISLFNGRDLNGWRVTDPAKKNGWSARDGVLRNETAKTDFSAYGDHANLRTEGEFTDFQLHLEFRLPADRGGNSGIYLGGRCEVQVTHRDSSMQGINGPGALFGRITPTTNAGKPAGEWEAYDITFVDRHVTVVHNGVKVIDNQPVAGPTGGALTADVSLPGPIMLQGDHTAVEYRNLVLRPAQPRATAANWPMWRGPRGDGTSADPEVPLQWSRTENIAWTTPIPGKGHSSPVVFGDRVFVTTCLETEQKHVLLCLDRVSGKILWERSTPAKLQKPIHRLNSHASSTPATDGRLVWVSFHDQPNMTIVAYDFATGAEVWRTVPGPMLSKHGYCSSVLPYRDTVILNSDQDGDGYLVALDQATGRERWRTARPHHTRSYCAPLITEVNGRRQLVLAGSLSVAAYDPDHGKLIWIIDGPTEQFVSSPIHLAGVIFLTYGFPKRGICAIDPTGEGNVTKSHVRFNLERASRGGYVPSPVAHGDLAFVVNDEGIGSCADPRTGREIWLQRLGRHHSASPVVARGHVYFFDDDGKCWIVKAQDTYELAGVNELGEEVYGSPAIARGQLFIRAARQLYCIGRK